MYWNVTAKINRSYKIMCSLILLNICAFAVLNLLATKRLSDPESYRVKSGIFGRDNTFIPGILSDGLKAYFAWSQS